ATGGHDLAAAAVRVQGKRRRRAARVGVAGADPGVHPGDRADPERALRRAGLAVRRAGALHGAQHHAAVAGAAADLRHRPAGRVGGAGQPRGRDRPGSHQRRAHRRWGAQSRRKYSTVVTTRTFLNCGLLWSRSLMVTTPWLALRMPPSREPESLANCSADSRAAAVASAISPGLMSLSLV